MTSKNKPCFECRNGERVDEFDKTRLSVIIEPDTGKMFRRGYLCSDHEDAYLSDGYLLK